MINTILGLINLAFVIYLWSLFALVIASWLVIFNIINPYQPLVRLVLNMLNRFHEPILGPIRALQYRLIPNAGGLDLSPIIAIMLVQFIVQPVLTRLAVALFI